MSEDNKLKTQNSELITQNSTSLHEEWIRRSDLRVFDVKGNTETASPSADGSQRMAIFNIQ
ncbi:MAG TPA: hypothetical protein DEQ34_00295 [Balneolaceae bacterium]|nr:hypothetical protein [Balneolaceae bacterium]